MGRQKQPLCFFVIWVVAGLLRSLQTVAAPQTRAELLDLQHIPFLNRVENIAVRGEQIYIGSGDELLVAQVLADGGARIEDDHLHLDEIRDLALQGDLLLVTTARGLALFDVATPGLPRDISLYAQSGLFRVFPDKDRAWVVFERDKLLTIDLRDLQAPKPQGIPVAFPGKSVTGAATWGDTLYVATQDSGIFVVDLTDPENPRAISRVDAEVGFGKLIRVGSTLLALVRDVEHSGVLGVVRHDSGFKVYSLDDPVQPEEVGRFIRSPSGAVDMVWADSVLYYLNGPYMLGDVGFHEYSLQTFDLTDRAKPNILDSLAIEPPFSNLSAEPRRLGLSAQTVWIAQGLGLARIDATDPSTLRFVGHVVNGAIARSIDADSEYVAVTDDGGGLHLFDRSDPGHLLALGRNPGVLDWGDVEIHNGLAYAASRGGGFRIYRLSQPPVEIGSVPLPGSGFQIDVVDTLAFVGDGPEGLTVVNVSDASLPRIYGRLQIPDRSVYNVQVVGSYAYVTYDRPGRPGFGVIDVADPRQPVEVYSEERHRYTYMRSLYIVKDRAYVQDDFGSLGVYDITSPSTPELLAQIATDVPPNDIFVEDDILYAAAAGIRLIDISDLSQPRLVCTTEGPALALVKEGNYLYVAAATEGIRTYFVEIATDVTNLQQDPPGSFQLYPNYPNPFNAQTVIRFDLPNPGRVSLRITNLLGQEVARLVDGWLPAGSHRVVWDGTSGGTRVKSGVYFYELRAGHQVEWKKMVVVR